MEADSIPARLLVADGAGEIGDPRRNGHVPPLAGPRVQQAARRLVAQAPSALERSIFSWTKMLLRDEQASTQARPARS